MGWGRVSAGWCCESWWVESWSVVVCASGFGVGGVEVGQWWCVLLGFVGWWVVVGRSLRLRVWGWWVEMVSGGLCCWIWGWWVGVGWAWVVLEGLGWVGWAWSVVVCACRFGVGGLGLVGRGLCLQVWHGRVGVGQWWFGLRGWWVGVGRSSFVHDSLGWVGWGW